MATNLTNEKIKDSFSQLLHIDGGPAAAEKVVLSAIGVPTALRVGTESISVGTVRIRGADITDLDNNPLFATAAQGTLAGTALQPADVGTAAFANTGDFATAAQGTLAGTALQPADVGTLAAQDFNNVDVTGGSVSVDTLGLTSAAYGTVTQATSKSTAVTLDKVAGRIIMDDASLSQNNAVTFTLNNSELGGNDVLIVNIAGGGTPGSYTVEVCCNQAGSALLKLRNVTNGALAEPVELLFAIIKVG